MREPAIERNRHNIVPTGPARSDTILSVFLLNNARNAVARDVMYGKGARDKFYADGGDEM